jgi:hypothetical protein
MMQNSEKLNLKSQIEQLEQEHRLLDERIRLLQTGKYLPQEQQEELKRLKLEKLKKKQRLYRLKGLLAEKG